MTMTELAREYRENAALLRERIKELRAVLREEQLCEMERLRLRGRVDMLAAMYRDTCEAALVMERYYDGRFRYHGAFKL